MKINFQTIAVLAAVLISSFALAADYFPELKNGKGTDLQQLPLGPIGGIISVQMETAEAKILSLAKGGPGDRAGLKAGDVLIGVGSGKFDIYSKKVETGGDGLPEQLGLAILGAQAQGNSLELRVRRGVQEGTVKVALPKLATFSKSYPEKCARSEALLTAACDWLAKSQNPNGTFGKKKSEYSNAFAALALLSSGDKKYIQNVKKTVDWLSDKIKVKKGPSESNWHSTATGILFAEYILATGDDSVLDGLALCCEAVGKRLEPETGRLGHKGTKLPYSGKALVITSAHAHLMWALADKAGVKLSRDEWDLSYKSVKAAIGKNGNIGYNFRSRSDYQSMARTGATATALSLLETSGDDLRGMTKWMEKNYKRSTNCHAVASMGTIFGFMGLKNSNESAWRENLDYHRWLFALVHPFDDDHGAYYYGKRGNFGGDNYLGLRTVGNYQTILMLASAKADTLWSFGNRKKGWAK